MGFGPSGRLFIFTDPDGYLEISEATMSVYQENGYKNRRDYLEILAEELGMDLHIVLSIADLLGPSEDFDGLVSELDDYQYLMTN